MTDPNKQLEIKLKYSGLSLTTPRKAVFEALLAGKPLSVQELVAACSASLVNRSSIYRTIQLFEDEGIIQRVQIGWKYKLELSSQFQNHHHHLFCRRCEEVFVLPEDPVLEAQLEKMAESNGFRLLDHQLEIQGLCSGCKAGKT